MCIDSHSQALKVQNSEVLTFDCRCVSISFKVYFTLMRRLIYSAQEKKKKKGKKIGNGSKQSVTKLPSTPLPCSLTLSDNHPTAFFKTHKSQERTRRVGQ